MIKVNNKIKYCLLFLYCLFTIKHQSCAQLVTVNNVGITVNASTPVTVQGDVLINTGGFINNNGVIDLNGNWTNNSAGNVFTSAFPNGTVILNGGAQNIGGTGFTIFNNLTLAGTGNKTLLQNIGVGGFAPLSGVLALNDRQLLLNSLNLTVRNPQPTAITRTTGFIISETTPVTGYGYITWNLANSAAGNNYIFPFGNNISGHFLPLNFNITTAGTGAGNGYVKVATYPTNTALNPNNRPLPTGLTALINNSGADNSTFVVDRYFIFDVAGYTTTPVTTMVFPYRDTEWSTGTNTIIENNLRMQRLNNGTQWTQPPFGTVNTINNTVTATLQNNYSPIWTIVDQTTPLPISLLYFKVSLNNANHALLNWSTENEFNSAFFDVEKSLDSRNYSWLTTLPASKFSNTTSSYHTTDSNPGSGYTFYRLKMVDMNGDFKYSNIEFVYTHLNQFDISVWPNPATDVINIASTSTQMDHSNYQLTNNIGQIISKGYLHQFQKSSNSYSIPIHNLPEGIYYLQLNNGYGKPFATKIFIQ